jgi:ribosome-associated protein
MKNDTSALPRTVTIDRQPIELYQLLKLADLAASGGEAKFAIARGEVRVNGQVETRKRKKIVAGDLVEFAGVQIRIAFAPGT